VAREPAGPRGTLNFRHHNARGDPRRVGECLSAEHRRRGAGRARHDGEQVTHPIEDHDGDAMRCTEPQGLDAHQSVPAGHDDGGGRSRARVVSQAAFAVVDKERAALDGEAGVVGLCRGDARLDCKAFAPKGVGLCIGDGIDGMWSLPHDRPRLRRWTKPPMSSQVALKRRPSVWPRGDRSVVLVRPERRGFAFADRGDDRRRVERIASRSPHDLPHLFSRETRNRTAAVRLSQMS
jgi:hypothetical protein